MTLATHGVGTCRSVAAASQATVLLRRYGLSELVFREASEGGRRRVETCSYITEYKCMDVDLTELRGARSWVLGVII